MDSENVSANLVRIGTVSKVDPAARKAQVFYPDLDNMVSGWLFVPQHGGAGVNVVPDGDHTHTIHDTWSGGGAADDNGEHAHEANVTIWMPVVGETVLVLYLPVRDADGFILGAI